jgi:hypothetical protein
MTSGNYTLFSVGRVQTALLNAIAIRNGEAARFISGIVPLLDEIEERALNGGIDGRQVANG